MEKGKDKHTKLNRVILFRLTAADLDALKAAATAYRKKTGENVTLSDLLRWGVAAVTKKVGISMSKGTIDIKVVCPELEG